MLIFLFTPRSSTDVPRQIGPVARLRIEGNKIRGGQSSDVVLAECSDRHWVRTRNAPRCCSPQPGN